MASPPLPRHRNSGALFSTSQAVFRTTITLLSQTGTICREEAISRFAAALAYYSALAVVPLAVIVLTVGSLVVGPESADQHLQELIQSVLGVQTAQALHGVVAHWRESPSQHAALTVAIIALLFSTSGALTQLQTLLDALWGVRHKHAGGPTGTLRRRLFSLLGLPGLMFLLLFSLFVTAGLEGPILRDLWPGVGHLIISYGFVMVVFALLFKLVPRAHVAWHDVWVGAALSALLFVAGRSAIVLFLGQSRVIALYGAAGPVVIMLLWAYYSSLVLMFGGAFTAAYASVCGSGIAPTRDAKSVGEPAKRDDLDRRAAP